MWPTVLAATDAIELFGALLFASAFVRRRVDREYALATLVCIGASARTTASIAASSVAAHGGASPLSERIGLVGLFAAMPFAIHFALVYPGGRPTARVLGPMYLGTAALALVSLLTAVSDAAHPAHGVGARVLSASGLGTFAFVFVAATTALVLVARAYLMGQRGALAVVLGATVLLASVIHDLGAASGAFAAVDLVDLGLAAFIVGIATTPSARYAAVTRELERRTQELRTRTRELRRSYEELRTAQEELVKKEQLAVVGELAAVIAHEVRNPLAIIANAGAGLRKQAISREDHETLLAILDEETSRLNRLVTDLLRYARPVNVQRSHMPLADLLERALSLASANNASKKKIRSELKMETNEGRIWGDANLLRQVFDNLIDNAMQAMGSDGALTVRVRTASEGGTDGLAVEIIDTGEGMDTQVRSRALDPFFTTRPSGTGLGLAIVDRIVDAHGGRLGIESRAGEGTTVTVFLPNGIPTEPPPSRSRGVRPSLTP